MALNQGTLSEIELFRHFGVELDFVVFLSAGRRVAPEEFEPVLALIRSFLAIAPCSQILVSQFA